jgi:tripartite-type tricarboxylate transporter receptor subunit TctC
MSNQSCIITRQVQAGHQIDMPGVPYCSTVQSLTAVIANEVPIKVDSLGASGGHIAGGRLRALTMTGRERSDRLPGVPTMMELGLDQREWVAWYAFMAPKGTPEDIVQKLNGVVNQTLQEDAIATRIEDLGASPRITTPTVMLSFIRQEREVFGTIARAGKIKEE